ncbi:MAG: alpha/beta hydrolase [Cytophagales bacterium]|nr:MAG: alpha/beta hydrolase [Cytophagales bacterium]
MSQLIKKENYQLACQIFGSGDSKLLAFHGYGQENSIYQNIAPAFPNHTIYSIDLFFHGKSEWHDGLDSLNFAYWEKIIKDFMFENQIDTFDLLGFSMGGRIALITASLFATKVQMLYLLAPDGIEINAWYRVATKFSSLQHIFKYFTHSETNIYKKVVKNLGKYGLVHKTVLKLAETEMATPKKRRRVYQTWMLYRFLEIERKKLAEIFNKHQVGVKIFLGKYDRLIHIQTVKSFTHLLEKSEIEILDCGHHKLVQAVMEKLSSSYEGSYIRK